MTDTEFMPQVIKGLREFDGSQQLVHEQVARDLRKLQALRRGLVALSGALALGLGLSAGYQITRK
jgi:hypothetical protein